MHFRDALLSLDLYFTFECISLTYSPPPPSSAPFVPFVPLHSSASAFRGNKYIHDFMHLYKIWKPIMRANICLS